MARLSEKDKKWLREEITNAVKEALTVKMHWEKVKDEKTGLPLAHPERWVEDVFLPSFFAQHIKFHEGAYRGFQEDINKTNNRVRGAMKQNKAIAKILLGNDQNIRAIARFVNLMTQSGLIEAMEERLLIESDTGQIEK